MHVPSILRRIVYKRARGCCEYCLIPEVVTLCPHQIDHIIAQKHGGLTEADNLALSCVICNKHKGSDLASLDPETGVLTPLFHCRQQRWSDHFKLEGALIVPLTTVGRTTARLLRLNLEERVAEREALIGAGVTLVPD